MIKRFVLLLLSISIVFSVSIATASDDSEIILKLLVKKGLITQQEVDEMKAELLKERVSAGVEAPKTLEDRVASVEKDLLSKVGLDKLSSKLKIKGRFAVGYFDSDELGSFNNGSFQAPEAKIQFTFLPDDINSVIMRMNLNNAAFNSMDYFYLDTNIMKLTPWEKSPFTLTSRIGRFKVDFGEETWSNNPVESILPSNSAANVAGSDEGLQLAGKIGKEKPLSWAVGIYNGNSGTGADNNWLKAASGKLSYNLLDPLYISGSYYYSGNLDTATSEMSIAGLATPPASAFRWSRQIGEVDVRYDYKKGKTLNPPAYCDSAAFVRAAYGHFIDDAEAPLPGFATAIDREGSYGLVEAMYNITQKLYAAARASFVGLNGPGNAASLNSTTANSYERYSFGLGYRLSKATLLKGEYTINSERKVPAGGGKDPNDNLVSFVIASQF